MRLFKRGQVWHVYVYENGVRVQRSTPCHDRKAAEPAAPGGNRGSVPDVTWTL